MNWSLERHRWLVATVLTSTVYGHLFRAQHALLLGWFAFSLPCGDGPSSLGWRKTALKALVFPITVLTLQASPCFGSLYESSVWSNSGCAFYLCVFSLWTHGPNPASYMAAYWAGVLCVHGVYFWEASQTHFLNSRFSRLLLPFIVCFSCRFIHPFYPSFHL